MATEGLRRSTRARKPVKTYLDEVLQQDKLDTEVKSTKRQPKSKKVTSGKSAVIADEKKTKGGKKRSRKTEDDDDAEDDVAATQPTKKAKKASTKVRPVTEANNWHESAADRRAAVARSRIRQLAPGQQEVRLKKYVDEPNAKFEQYFHSATTQRMFVLDRERSVETNCHANHTDCPCETLQIAGSAGNVYTVKITHLPTCSCPVGIFQKKRQEQCCKHVLYVLDRVLKAPDYLKCQNAFLSHELRSLLANAPLAIEKMEDDGEELDGNRKSIEGDCPICFTEFEDGEDIVWCRAACGNNIHEGCFKQWENSKHGKPTCPFCRSAWQSADLPKSQKANVANIPVPAKTSGMTGYRNVRHLLDYED